MAIANIVCRGGVGPASAIKFFVTHGLEIGGSNITSNKTIGAFSQAAALAVTVKIASTKTIGSFSQLATLAQNLGDTHDGFVRKRDVVAYQKKLKAQQAAIEAREQEKLNQIKQLRQQIEDAVNPPQPALKATITTKNKEKAISVGLIDQIPQYRAKLFELERDLVNLAQEMATTRRRRDEEDMKIILELLSDDFKTMH